MIVLSTLFALLSLFALLFSKLFSGPASMAPIVVGPTTPTGRLLHTIPTPEPTFTAEMEKVCQATFFESFEEGVNRAPVDDRGSSVSETTAAFTVSTATPKNDSRNFCSCHDEDISCLTKKLVTEISRRLWHVGVPPVKLTTNLIAAPIKLTVKVIQTVILAVLQGIFSAIIYALETLCLGVKAAGEAMQNAGQGEHYYDVQLGFQNVVEDFKQFLWALIRIIEVVVMVICVLVFAATTLACQEPAPRNVDPSASAEGYSLFGSNNFSQADSISKTNHKYRDSAAVLGAVETRGRRPTSHIHKRCGTRLGSCPTSMGSRDPRSKMKYPTSLAHKNKTHYARLGSCPRGRTDPRKGD